MKYRPEPTRKRRLSGVYVHICVRPLRSCPFNESGQYQSLKQWDGQRYGSHAFLFYSANYTAKESSGYSLIMSQSLFSRKTLLLIGLALGFLQASADTSPGGKEYDVLSEGMYFSRQASGALSLVDADPYAVENLVIPAAVGGEEVVDVAANAFQSRIDIESVTIGPNVVSIGQYAFAAIEGLASVDFSNAPKLQTIGAYAFKGSGITSVNLPASLVSLNSARTAFSGCTQLRTVQLGVRQEFTTNSMFSGCSSLSEVSLPEGMTTLGDNMFTLCTSLTSISLPSTVRTIKSGVFSNCTSLKTLIIPENSQLTTIRGYAFQATIIEEFILPASVTEIDGSAFSYTKLPNARLTIKNPDFVPKYSLGGYFSELHIPSMDLFWNYDIRIGKNKDTGMAVYIGDELVEELNLKANTGYTLNYIKGLKRINIPDCTTKLEYDFSYNYDLEELHVGRGSTTLKSLRGCKSLVTVDVDERNTLLLSGSVFSNCTSLRTFSHPKVTELPGGVFGGCTSLESIDLPALTTLTNSNFGGCKSLKELDFPLVTKVEGHSVYSTCESLTRISFGALTNVPDNYFSHAPALKEVSLPSAESVGKEAFFLCNSLVKVELPKVTKIGESAFRRCENLREVTAPKLLQLAGWAFYECHSLLVADYPELITSEDQTSVFEDCRSLVRVNLPKVNYIPSSYFKRCSSLSDLTTSPLLLIAGSGFYGCSSLENIDLSKAHEIGDNAFANCTSLKYIDVANATMAYDNVFINCPGLIEARLNGCPLNLENSKALEKVEFMTDVENMNTRIVMAGNPATLIFHGRVGKVRDDAFNGSTALEKVYFEKEVGSFGTNAFYRCGNIREVHIGDFDSWISASRGVNGGFAEAASVDYYISGTLVENLVIDNCRGVSSESFAKGTFTSVCVNPATGAETCAIGDRAFYGCASASEITLGEGITAIGTYVFTNCSKVETLKIPETVTSIGEYALSYMSSLRQVTLSPGIAEIPAGLLTRNPRLEQAVFPEGVTTLSRTVIGDGCTALRFISIPSTCVSFSPWYLAGRPVTTFSNLHRDAVFYCYAQTPPNPQNENFDGVEFHIPAGSRDAYYELPAYSRANLIEDIDVVHSAAPSGSGMSIKVPLNSSGEEYLDIHRFVVTVTPLDGDGAPTGENLIFEFNADGTPRVAAPARASAERVLKIENLSPDTEYSYALKAYTAYDDLIVSRRGKVRTSSNTTGIDTVSADEPAPNAEIYDLQGRPVAEPLPGRVYIRNGRKIIL